MTGAVAEPVATNRFVGQVLIVRNDQCAPTVLQGGYTTLAGGLWGVAGAVGSAGGGHKLYLPTALRNH